MKKNFKAVLCVTALLGAMSILPANSKDMDITSDTKYLKPVYSGTMIIHENGHLEVNSSLDNNGIIDNQVGVENTSLGIDIRGELDNREFAQIKGEGGRLHVENGGRNSGSISQGIIDLTSGTFINIGIIEANILKGGADIIDNGSLTIYNGSDFTGGINQNKVTINSYGNLNVSKYLTAKNLENNGHIFLTGDNASITADNLWGAVTSSGKSTSIDIFGDIVGALDIASGSSLKIINGTAKDNLFITISEEATLNIAGGDVTFAENASSNGTISLNGGSLTLNNKLEYGKLEANSGKLNIVYTTLNKGSYVKNDVELNAKDGKINVLNGELNINNGDNIEGANISTSGENSIFNYGSEKDQEFQLSGDGNINILENSNLTLTSNSSVSGNFNLQKDATITLNGANLTIGNTSSWEGAIKNDGGWLQANNLTSTSSTASYIQNSGSTDIINSNITFNKNSAIKGGDILLNNSTLNLVNANVIGGNINLTGTSVFNYNGGSFNINSMSAQGANGIENVLINTMNGKINNSTIGSMSNVGNQANFYIDILSNGNSAEADQFKIGSLSDDSKLFIKDWALSGEVPSQSSIQLGSIFTDNDGNPLLGDNISVTDKTVSNPIGKYRLNRNSLAGTYSLDMTGYNSQVFRGQVATIAQWQNQLAIDDMLFTHSMVLPSFKEENSKYANKYAATDPLFAPYQYSNKDGGLWYKAYGTFEHLQMNQGLDVGNNSYGTLVGADFGMKELKKGWNFMPTAYLGYNGAHQYFSGVSQYQNGGQMGFMGTWYKDNFIVSSLTYGGVYDNQMDVAGHSENSFNYFAGTAAKAAYNWKLHKDLSLQPNLMVAYNYFGQQNWHSDYGQIGMMSGMMHGVNIAPGVNLIWEKETFSTYLTLQYMYNVNGAVNGNAGNVDLPNVEMERGYIQYGVGATKKLTDRCSGYFQAVLRNVGRTGVGFQAGFNIKLGKKNK